MLEVGRHCEQCGFLDFLPFVCTRCGQTLCSDHRTFDTHKCFPGPGQAAPSDKATPRDKAALGDKGTPSLKVAPSSGIARRSGGHVLGGNQATRGSAATRNSVGGTGASRGLAPAARPKESLAKPAKATESRTAVGPAALDRLRAFLAGRPGKSSQPAPPKQPARFDWKQWKDATGDEKVPPEERVYVTLTRPQSTYADPVLQKTLTRPSKQARVFYAASTKLGRVADRSGTLLGITVAGLTLNGKALELGTSLSAVPSGSELVVVAVEPRTK